MREPPRRGFPSSGIPSSTTREDPEVYGLEYQFMVGTGLMVAPVLDPGTRPWRSTSRPDIGSTSGRERRTARRSAASTRPFGTHRGACRLLQGRLRGRHTFQEEIRAPGIVAGVGG